MEMLSWMKKVNGDMKKIELLQVIDEIHAVVDALLQERKENLQLILDLKKNIQDK